MGKVWEIVMSVVSDWHGAPEVRAIEDKIKVFCIGMYMSINMYVGVEYEVHCHHKDVHMTYRLLRKLAQISLRDGIKGEFTLTTQDVQGNTIRHSISAW